ncbi:DUF1707 SHOCT-like domain-containing protein [Microlunatus speluncae]|uniref:DUF1707 SHOCT-like domain-containing protein n=1 Tax=Microlunatus speluncae TaxID=2594267 RepID=UPI0012660906|nr:DUF1707 domain-containing protein [Microlunatus speluncae]
MTEPGRERLRVGHSERDAAAEALRDAAADGRITLEELDERLERALLARTYGELDALFEDLQTASPAVSPAPASPAHPQLPGYSAEDRLVLSGGMSSEKRSGTWDVPPFIRIEGGAGTVRLNCLEARPLASVIDIEVVGAMGTMVIVTPEDWAANTDRLSKGWGSVASKIATTPGPGKPLLLLHGTVGMGSLSIRHASRSDLRKLAKEARQRRAIEGPR